MYKKIKVRKLMLLSLLIVLFGARPVFAVVSTWATSDCSTTSSAVFNLGNTVYTYTDGMSGASKLIEFRYLDPSAFERCYNSQTATTTACDAVGCPLDLAWPTGSWSVDVYKKGVSVGSAIFTVNAAPEFPNFVGLIAVVLLCGTCYLYMKKSLINQ